MTIKKRLVYGGTVMLFALGGVTASAGAASAAPAPYRCGHGWHCTDGRGSDFVYADASKGSGPEVRVDFNRVGKHQYLRIADHFRNHHRTVALVKVGGSGTAKFYGPYRKDGHLRSVRLHYSHGKSIKVKVCTSNSRHAVCSHYSPAGRT